MGDVSIRAARAGRDGSMLAEMMRAIKFLSVQPVRAATRHHRSRCQEVAVSIHATRVGRDAYGAVLTWA